MGNFYDKILIDRKDIISKVGDKMNSKVDIKYDFSYIKKKIDELEEKNKKLKKENEILRHEIKILQSKLVAKQKSVIINHKINEIKSKNTELQDNLPDITINKKSKPEEKIALFKSLFKGRDDVFAIRWENKDKTKSGYSPACKNEWVEGICHRTKIKCSNCIHRKLIEISDQVIYNHLSGDNTIGLFPLRKDDTCYFLAIDFDKRDWKEDVSAFMNVCRENDVPTVVERSRSGNGAHIWLFFNTAIKAIIARKLGFLLLTKTMESRYQLGLSSYDRLFPNQDRLPKGGFGNLIALPLQKKALEKGNSAFVNENFFPFKDQWSFLASIKKMNHAEVNQLVKKLDLEDNKDNNLFTQNDTFSDLPKEITILYRNKIFIFKQSLSSKVILYLVRLASFPNPDFYKAQALRLSTYKIPRIINTSENYHDKIALPRGCFDDVGKLFEKNGVKVNVKYHWNDGKRINADFIGELKDRQSESLEALLKFNTGILSATTGFGKTIIAIALIANIKRNTLIIVHTRQLLEQWKEKLNAFLDIKDNEIGQYGAGKKNRTGYIDIALIQSLNYKNQVKEFVSEYGLVIVDECHHISAFSFETVLKHVTAKYVYGLTATLIRKDGHHPIVKMQLGPVRYEVKAKSMPNMFNHIVRTKYTKVIFNDLGEQSKIHQLYQELIDDDERNRLIVRDILEALSNKKTPLVLTERTIHLERLAFLLKEQVGHVYILRGGMGRKVLKDMLKQIEQGLDQKGKCVVLATGKFVGEGFDDSRLDTLFLTLPISWRGTLQQYVGRLHRNHIDKEEVIVYDYIDEHPILEKMYKKRVRGYKALGYEIID